MNEKAEAGRDVFAFSRGGLTVIASFVAAPTVASDRINQARDERVRQSRDSRPDRVQDNRDCSPDPAGVPQGA